jgi:hypothetical protein
LTNVVADVLGLSTRRPVTYSWSPGHPHSRPCDSATEVARSSHGGPSPWGYVLDGYIGLVRHHAQNYEGTNWIPRVVVTRDLLR